MDDIEEGPAIVVETGSVGHNDEGTASDGAHEDAEPTIPSEDLAAVELLKEELDQISVQPPKIDL